MKKTIFAATAALALLASAPAMAQAVPVSEVGAAFGSVDGDNNAYSVRAQFGDTTVPFGANLETTFDSYRSNELIGANLVFENALTDRIGSYALAGVGYRWANRGNEDATWTYGGGLTYAVTDRTELDLRARTVNSFENDRDDTLYTLGVNFAF